MKAIITGGSGFIGRSILDELKNQNDFEIRTVVHDAPLATRHQDFEQWSGGIAAITEKRLKQFEPDIILHLARPTMPQWRWIGRVVAGFQGAAMNKSLLKKIEEYAPNCKLIYLSGSLMYGESSNPHFEKSPINPISYARQYVRIETPIIKSLEQKDNNHLVIRVPWVLGDGSWFQWIYADHFKKTGAIPLFGAGNNQMQFISRKSLAKTALSMAIDPKVNGIRNVFGETMMSQLGFAQMMTNQLKCELDSNTNFYEKAIQEAFQANIVLDSSFAFDRETREQFNGQLNELVQGLLQNK